MTRSKHILNELEGISPAVANISVETPYELPAGYFDLLANEILAKVLAEKSEESVLLKGINKQTPFDIPEDYFKYLSDSILSKVRAQETLSVDDELQELSPLLYSLSKENVYSVPAGYFESVAKAVGKKAPVTSEAKVVGMFARTGWMKMAAAAVVLVMVAFGIKMISSGSSDSLDGYVKAGLKNYQSEEQVLNDIQTINEADLVSYLQMTADTKDAEIVTSVFDTEPASEEGNSNKDVLLESIMNEVDQTIGTQTN